MTRRWRALAFWGAVVVLVAGAVVWRARALRAGMDEEVASNYRVTTRALLVTVTAWAQVRVAHAEAMAELLADDAAPEARFTRATAALARHGTFVGGWVLDASGRVLARAAAAATPDPTLASRDAPDGGAARGGVWTQTVPCGALRCVAFHAAVRPAAGRAGAVGLLAAVDDSTFRPLNPMRPHIRTGRTSILAAVDGMRDVVVVASVGAPASPAPAGRRTMAAAPPHVRAALAGAPGVVTTGRGPGLHGREVHYALARVPGLDWVVVRELDRAEVLDAVRGALLFEAPVFTGLFVSLVLLARHRYRARRARRAQELTRLRADFVASTSHELRTPLAQIRMFAELLQKGTLRGPEESARALRIIEKEASRLTILVDNLLNYSRLRRRADAAALAAIPPTHVADEVAHVIEAFAPLAAERGARVVCAVPDGLYARVDSLALRQVLTNYLENAVKYGPSAQTITVDAAADARRVRVWVDDQGAGVPRDERALVWEAFRRGRAAEASAQSGSGIGLAVVRELALQYGGEVLVDDAPAGGARFTVAFPRADDRAR